MNQVSTASGTIGPPMNIAAIAHAQRGMITGDFWKKVNQKSSV
jgi:hypothetical protein